MFERRERWLEELREYVDRKELITNTTGHMPITSLAEEITAACADPRKHDYRHSPSWQSMARDLDDCLDWIGPSLHTCVSSAASAVHKTITQDLITANSRGKTSLDDSKRPVVANSAAALLSVLNTDASLVAAWSDLVTACRDIDHKRYPSERVAFLRDTLMDINEHRNQSRGHWSPIATAVQVLFANPSSVLQAQEMVGDPVDPDDDGYYDPHAEVDLSQGELFDLAERCIIQRPKTGTSIVWFRLQPAFIHNQTCVSHGDITFYDALTLASSLTDHQRVRETFDSVPEELLTEEIRDLQRSNEVNEFNGFEYHPQLVYARVTVRNVERHRAVDTARTHLTTVLAVIGAPNDMWKILDGTLRFDGTPTYFPAAHWGLKHPHPKPVMYQNDSFTTNLSETTGLGHVISANAAQQLQPALRLFEALTRTPALDAETTVMDSVRAIEHCNTWTAPRDGHHWNTFIEQYLLDEYAVTAFARRVVHDVLAAAEQHVPDRTQPTSARRKLQEIRTAIRAPGQAHRIDTLKTTQYVAELRNLYTNRWLQRQLAETDDILSSGTRLRVAFENERKRAAIKMQRLTRSRNAAIHGGPLSATACATIARFATTLAQQALTTIIWSTVIGEPTRSHAQTRRDEFQLRNQKLSKGGDLANLFTLTT